MMVANKPGREHEQAAARIASEISAFHVSRLCNQGRDTFAMLPRIIMMAATIAFLPSALLAQPLQRGPYCAEMLSTQLSRPGESPTCF